MEKLDGWGQVAYFTFQNVSQRAPYAGHEQDPEHSPSSHASSCPVQKAAPLPGKVLQQTKIDLRSLYHQLLSLALLSSAYSLAAKWRLIWYIFICKIRFGEERDIS